MTLTPCDQCLSPMAPGQDRCYWCQVQTEPGFDIDTVRSRVDPSHEDEIVTAVIKTAPLGAVDLADFLTDIRATGEESHPPERQRPMGREVELRTLDEAWATVLETQGFKRLDVQAAAGMGKTQLVRYWLEHGGSEASQAPLWYFHGYSGVGEDSSSGGILARLVRHAIGLSEGAPAEELRAKLDSWVEAHTPRAQRGAAKSLLARLCGTPYPGTGSFDTPSVLVRRTARALAAALVGASQARPFVLWLDDAEALSGLETEIVAQLVQRLSEGPCLCIIGGRSLPQAPGFESQGLATSLSLGPLDKDDAEAMVRALVSPGEPMPSSLMAVVVHRSQGVPGAIVQALVLLADHGLLHRDSDGWRVDENSPNTSELPEDLGLLLDSRLAMLDAYALALLRTASVAGLSFPLESLLACAPGSEDKSLLRSQVLELQRQDLIRFIEDEGPDTRICFCFRGESERLRVLAGLSREEQGSIHRRFASWWAGHHRKDEIADIARVASHWEQGHRPRKAAPWHLYAGKVAAERYENLEASLRFGRALEALDPEDAAARVPVLHERARLALRSGDWELALRDYRAMAHEAAFVGQGSLAAEALLGAGQAHHHRGDWQQALEVVAEAQGHFETFGDWLALARCLDTLGQIRLHQGTPRSRDEAQADFELALKLRDEAGDAAGVAQSYHNLGWVYGDRGHFKEAVLCYEQAILMRRELDDRENLARSLNNLGDTQLAAGEHQHARRLLREALSEAEEVGAAAIRSVVMANLARSFLDTHQLGDARTWIDRVEECLQEREDRYGVAELHVLRSRLLQGQGQHAEALAEAHKASDLVEIMEGGELHGVVLRRLGELLSATLYTPEEGTRRDEDAEDYFQRSLLALQASGHDIEMARTLKSYGEYLLERGKRREGEDLLRRAEAVLKSDPS